MNSSSDTKENRRRGANKHCVFGDCNSDSRPGRPGYTAQLRFISFPKPCLTFRKMDNVDVKTERDHLKVCATCRTCDEWMKACKRQDPKWKRIGTIKKDSYICENHFVDIDALPLPPPLTALQITHNKAKPKRKPLSQMYLPNKRAKFDANSPDYNVESSTKHGDAISLPIPVLESNTRTCVTQTFMDNSDNQNSFDEDTLLAYQSTKDAETSTVISTRTLSTQTTFRSVDEQVLKSQIKDLKREIRGLKTKLESCVKKKKSTKPIEVFEEKIKKNEVMCKFYTGFVYAQILLLFDFVACETMCYWGSKGQPEKLFAKKKMQHIQELILSLVRLRTGLLVRDLAYRFELSTGLVSKIFTTWIQVMFNKFNMLLPLMFPSREKIKETLPASFSRLRNIRVIIDCAEIFCENPSNLAHQANLYSSYKSHTTFKVLIGCTPNGAVSFVSDLFEGSISDRQIVAKSKLLDLLEDGDLVLADRGFTIKDMTDEININLNIPAFLKGREKLSAQEEIETKIIARQRIYVEHVVGRIKNFRLLKKIVPLSMRGTISQAVFVSACLLNFQKPLVQ